MLVLPPGIWAKAAQEPKMNATAAAATDHLLGKGLDFIILFRWNIIRRRN